MIFLPVKITKTSLGRPKILSSLFKVIISIFECDPDTSANLIFFSYPFAVITAVYFPGGSSAKYLPSLSVTKVIFFSLM